MKVILLENVAKVGKKYEIKNVSDGYALNFMIPKGLAKMADDKTIKALQKSKEKHEVEIREKEENLFKNIGKLKENPVTIKAKANAKGHLFAGIHKDEVVSEIEKQIGVSVDPDFIELEKAIKETGDHKVLVEVGDKKEEFEVKVESK